MIRAERLSRHFGGRVVVKDVSFEVEPGEVLGFLGPNGAGKTTTIRMLLGLLRPSGGSAEIDRPAGYLPEVFRAYESLTVRGYLSFMARIKGAPRNEPERVMNKAGIENQSSRVVGRLSKGQRQRLGLAQSLLGHPRSYILDEPTQGLDPKQIADTRRTIRRLADEDGAAVMLSTHLLSEAAEVCDRVAVIVQGQVVAIERPGDAPELEERFLRLIGRAELG